MQYTFKKGLSDGLPICLGYLSVAFAFGIFAVSNGLSGFQALLISMANCTSAGQLAAVPVITAGGMLSELAVSQLVINLRYSLMSVSLSQKLDQTVRLRDKLLIAFVNTDEVFAVASAKPGPVGRRYLYGLILPPYVGWSTGTLLGAVAGDVLPAVLTGALGIAIYGMFIAIVVPTVRRSRPAALCVLLALLFSCAFYYLPFLKTLPSGFTVIICAAAAAAIAAAMAPVNTGEGGTNE